MAAACAQEASVERDRVKVRTRVDVTLKQNASKTVCMGDIRLRNIRKMLDSVGVVRSPDQIAFHEAFIEALLPVIFGESWSRNSIRVMKQFRLTKIDYEILILTPRR